jgi:hypothetical protein
MDSTPTLPSAPPPAIPQKSGGGKKWVLFGCGGCLGLIVIMAIIGAVFVNFVFGVIKGTDVYQTAFKRAQNSSEVQAALGIPIKDGFAVSGSVDMNNGQGSGDINFPISGPKGDATVTAKASKQPNAPWEYTLIQVRVTSTGQIIDLTEAP